MPSQQEERAVPAYRNPEMRYLQNQEEDHLRVDQQPEKPRQQGEAILQTPSSGGTSEE